MKMHKLNIVNGRKEAIYIVGESKMKNLIQKLIEFGFSTNQARVYEAIACRRCTTVSQISKATGIHTQDVYKTIAVLEKKGLLLRTFSKPIAIEALPI